MHRSGGHQDLAIGVDHFAKLDGQTLGDGLTQRGHASRRHRTIFAGGGVDGVQHMRGQLALWMRVQVEHVSAAADQLRGELVGHA